MLNLFCPLALPLLILTHKPFLVFFSPVELRREVTEGLWWGPDIQQGQPTTCWMIFGNLLKMPN